MSVIRRQNCSFTQGIHHQTAPELPDTWGFPWAPGDCRAFPLPISLYVPIWSRLEIYQNPNICASRGRAAPSWPPMGRGRLVPWVGTHQSPPGALGAPAPSLSLQHPVVRATQTPPLEILGTPQSLPRGIWKETARSSAPPQNEHFPPPSPVPTSFRSSHRGGTSYSVFAAR